MRRLGDFVEFFGEVHASASVHDAERGRAFPELRSVIEYLRGAPDVLDVMEQLPDVFDGEFIELTGSLQTDGVWYWREDLVHYVEKYCLALPVEFIERVLADPPELSHAELVAAAHRVITDWSGANLEEE